jgi:hypothetical protein
LFFQYGKTAKFYVYSPGEIDLNALINRCKEMPRKRGPEGKPKHYAVPPEQLAKQDQFVHSNPPKGRLMDNSGKGLQSFLLLALKINQFSSTSFNVLSQCEGYLNRF